MSVTFTPAAHALLTDIVADHGPVLFHLSGGCCDGTTPMCYPAGEFRIGAHDVLLSDINGTPFYISGTQAEAWGSVALLIDAEPGRGGSFSLDNARGQHFVVRSDRCA